MQIINDDDSRTTPLALMGEGQAWLDFYNFAVKDSARNRIMPGIYCLFSSLEMHLKAYIVLKDSTYSEPNNLKKLQHNFNLMYERLSTLTTPDFIKLVKTELKRYKLMELDINKLKYPEIRRFWSVDNGLERGQHSLNPIFEKIQQEVDGGNDEWMNNVYPRKSYVTALLQGEWEHYPEESLLEKWIVLCPDCRPANIILARKLSWPWCLEKQPSEFCRECGAMYEAYEPRLKTNL